MVFFPHPFLYVPFGLRKPRKLAIPVGSPWEVKPVTKRVTFAEAIFLPNRDDPKGHDTWVVFDLLSFHGPVSFEHASFDSKIYLLSARFHSGANFDDARFGTSALLGFADRNSDLPSWPEYSLSSPVTRHLKPAIFGGKTSFRRARFAGSVTFYGCQFNEVDFSEAQFSEGADFMGTEFNAEAIFQQASFEQGVRFGLGDVEWVGANGLFVGDADFSGVRFRGAANFRGDKFHEDINRIGSTAWQLLSNFRWRWSDYRPGPFGGTADFTNAQFAQSAEFSGAHLKFSTFAIVGQRSES